MATALARRCAPLSPRLASASRPGTGNGVGAVRGIRAGFFPDDEDYIDPSGPLFAERLGVRWRYMDDPTLQAPVLERSNVGMGMLVLNRPAGMDLRATNSLYRRLRDVEVNSLKRFVGLTAVDPGPFGASLDPRELLLAATAATRTGRLPRFSRALLWHHQELAHLVADFRKPVVAQLSGSASSGASLASLASFSGVWEDSEVAVDSCMAGLVPMGGMTYILGGLPFHLGEFLALTAWPVKGVDLVYAGLAKHWLSPEALPFLELTAEKHLEVSEADSRALLNEHSLPLPPGLEEGGSLPSRLIPLIDRAFRGSGVGEIVNELKRMAMENNKGAKLFANECLARMHEGSPLALHATLALVQEARQGALAAAAIARAPTHGLDERGQHGPLMDALRRELRAQERLLCSSDAVVGLHARCLGQTGRCAWSRKNVTDVVRDVEVKDLLAPPERGADFAVLNRSEVSLSSHPRLRRYHPDFNAETGLDHDPQWMAAEAQRWSPDLFAEERRRLVGELLGDVDPAAAGLSRWTRVDSP